MAELEEKKEEEIKKDNEETDAEETAKKFTLSTSLLIKIAIGLLVLIIAMGAAYFFWPASDADIASNGNDEEEVVEGIAENAIENSENEPASIELPLIPTETAGADESTEVSNLTESAVTPATPSTEASVANTAELTALQQQITALQAEKDRLNQQVENLTETNQALTQQVSTTKQQLSQEQDIETPVTKPRPILRPSTYASDPYKYSPKFELEPKWGE